MSSRRGTVLVMAGGTGGHVAPGLAVAELLRERGADVHWMGTDAGVEADMVPKAGIALSRISIKGVRGRGAGAWLSLPWRLSRALWQSWRIMRRLRPGCVLGMGGFASFPGGLAAWLSRRPLVIHEQNAVAGTANRWLAWLASRVLEGMPDSFAARFAARCVGNPTRADIRALRERPSSRPEGVVHLLILGGSRGAWALNRHLPEALAALSAAARVQVRHQSGKADAPLVAERYRQLGLDARVDSFIDDMAAAYRWADLVVCRAGASTLAELSVVGLGALLVPLPHAVDDHQHANARWFTGAGAGVLVSQDSLTSGALSDVLPELLGDPARCASMAAAARALGSPDAAAKVAAECLEALR